MKKYNKTDNLERKLLDYGLTEKQAKVYLAALELGQASVQAIAEKARIERTNTYDSIESLVEKRLMSITTSGKKHLFIAESPDILGRILDDKKAELKQLLPELQSIFNVSEVKPRIRFYPGVEGFKTVYADTLTCQEKNMAGIFAMKDFLEIAGRDFLERMVEGRVKRGINLKVIRSQEREVAGLHETSKQEMRDLRYSPLGLVFPISTFVYDNKVIYLSSKKETFGLIIESKDIAQAHKNYFEALWQISKPVN